MRLTDAVLCFQFSRDLACDPLIRFSILPTMPWRTPYGVGCTDEPEPTYPWPPKTWNVYHNSAPLYAGRIPVEDS